MKNEPSIKKNFIMNTILTMSSFVFPLITFPYVTRVLLPVGTGKVAFAVALIQYFTMFSQLGIPTYGVRACAKVRDDKEELTRVTHELLIITLIMSGISYFVLAISLVAIPRLYEDRSLYIVVSVTILLTSIGMEWLYKALEKYTYIAVRSIAFKIVALVAMFLLVHTKDDYVIYGGISIFAASASNLVNFINARKYIDWKKVGSYNFKRHFNAVGIFFAMACATIIYTYVDELMLGFLTSNTQVGYYDASVKIKKILVSVVTSLGVVVLPRASYFVQQNRMEEFWLISKKALNFVIILSTSLMIYFILFAEEVITFLAGNAYHGSVIPMQIIMPTLLFIGLTNIMGIQILVPLGGEKTVLWSVVLGAIVDVIINIMLIPKYGASGAAVGTTIAEAVVFIFQYVALRKYLKDILKEISYVKVIVSLVAAAILAYVVKISGFGLFITLAISSVAYFAIYGIGLLLLKEPLVKELFVDVKNVVKKGKN